MLLETNAHLHENNNKWWRLPDDEWNVSVQERQSRHIEWKNRLVVGCVEMSIPPIVNSRGSTPDFCEPSVQPAPQRILQLRSRVRQCQKKKQQLTTSFRKSSRSPSEGTAHRVSTIPLVRSMHPRHRKHEIPSAAHGRDAHERRDASLSLTKTNKTVAHEHSHHEHNAHAPNGGGVTADGNEWRAASSIWGAMCSVRRKALDLFFIHRAREKKSQTARTAAPRQDKMQTQRHVNDGFDVVSSAPPF